MHPLDFVLVRAHIRKVIYLAPKVDKWQRVKKKPLVSNLECLRVFQYHKIDHKTKITQYDRRTRLFMKSCQKMITTHIYMVDA